MGFAPNENELDLGILELKRQWQRYDAADPPQCLWIVCSDLALDRPVERIMEIEPTLMLRCPANRLSACANPPFDGASAIDFAVDSLSVSDIIICGHSACNGMREAAPIPLPISRLDRASARSGCKCLLERNQQRQELAERAKQNVVQQLANLATYPSVTAGMERGKLQVHGLFYLCESGVFLRYDAAVDGFSMLGELAWASL